MPSSVTESDGLVALLAMTSFAVRRPATAGAKVIAASHLAPAAS